MSHPSPLRSPCRLVGALVLGAFGWAGCAVQAPLTAADYRTLLPALEAQVDARPADASARRALAVALVQVDEMERAYVALLEAERLEDDPQTYYALGLAEEALGNLDEAAARYEEANPASPYASAMAGRAARLARSIAEADLAAVLDQDGYPEPPFAEGDVAVLPFAAEADDPRARAFGRAVSEVVAAALASGGLRVVPTIRVAALLRHHALSPGDIDPTRAQRLGRLLQARHAVIGQADRDRLGATLVASAADGGVDTVGVGPVPASWLEGAPEVAAQLLDALGADLPPETGASLPTDDLEAFALYGRALLEEDAGRVDEAAVLYRAAAGRDPGFRLAAARAAALGGSRPPPPGDALRALRLTDGLEAADGLVARRIGALGHTLGGLVAPEAGGRNPGAEVGPRPGTVDPFPDPPAPPGGS